MLYIYDRAICRDLKSSFTDEMQNSVVKVVEPDMAIDVASQISNDEFQFPAVVLTRSADYQLDQSRYNFNRLHKGVSAVIDPETNNIYDERSIPISLSYNLTVLTSNSIDMDELVKELLFKYSSMYFLTIDLPYESSRKIRFGLCLDESQPIEQTSRLLEYMQSGKAYQSIIHLRTEGCVLLSYTPRKLPRYEEQVELLTNARNYKL